MKLEEKSAREIAEVLISNPYGYTKETIKLAEEYIKLIKSFGIYESDKVYKK